MEVSDAVCHATSQVEALCCFDVNSLHHMGISIPTKATVAPVSSAVAEGIE